MAKQLTTARSRYSKEAVRFLGRLIRAARIERRQTAEDLAARAGISRGLLARIEQGDPGCAIGSVFEVASLLGVPLFDLDKGTLRLKSEMTADRLTMLPKTARSPRKPVKDDF